MTTTPVTLDVWYDVICPWCFLGHRFLSTLLDDQPAGAVRVRWRAFELQPERPTGGSPAKDFFAARFGAEQEVRRVLDAVTAVGAQAGIAFAFERIARVPNSRRPHQLVALARRAGVQAQVVDALFTAYFERGVDIGDLDALAVIARVWGINEHDLRAGEGLPDVEADLALADDAGVQAVPFVLADRLAFVVGVQPRHILSRLLSLAREQRRAT